MTLKMNDQQWPPLPKDLRAKLVTELDYVIGKVLPLAPMGNNAEAWRNPVLVAALEIVRERNGDLDPSKWTIGDVEGLFREALPKALNQWPTLSNNSHLVQDFTRRLGQIELQLYRGADSLNEALSDFVGLKEDLAEAYNFLEAWEPAAAG
jgi:hypothetical protein